MNNAPAIFRSLIIYSVCVLLAVWVGFMATELASFSSQLSFIYAGIFILVLSLPLLLKWHYPMLVLSINLGVTIFFLWGQPPLWMPMLALSFAISIFHRSINRDVRFISAPSITWPFIFLAAVVLVTMKLTGGIGLHSLGSEQVGGKKYVFVLSGILAYFALTARRIQPKQAPLYIGLLFLPQCLSVVGDLIALFPFKLGFLYVFFHANNYILAESQQDVGGFRFAGISMMGFGAGIFMMAKYGIRGIFLGGKIWRTILFVCLSCLVPMGGFRSMIAGYVIIFTVQFFLEKLYRTKLMPRFIFAGILGCALLVPLTPKLPYAVQRALSFLPLDVDLAAKQEAEWSSEWRYKMWQALLPEVPKHLFLGKGYVISAEDYEYATSQAFDVFSADQNTSAIAGDYHSGPLSVVIPFGIWGVIAVLWLFAAGLYALFANFRYGEQSLRTINTFLLALFIQRIISFIFIFGALENETIALASILGLSVAINGGICRSKPVPVKAEQPALVSLRLQVGFQR